MVTNNIISKSFNVAYVAVKGEPSKSVLIIAQANTDIEKSNQQKIVPLPVMYQNEEADLLYRMLSGSISPEDEITQFNNLFKTLFNHDDQDITNALNGIKNGICD